MVNFFGGVGIWDEKEEHCFWSGRFLFFIFGMLFGSRS